MWQKYYQVNLPFRYHRSQLLVSTETLRRLSKWDVVLIDVDAIISATELQERYKCSFWDSLIIASAIAGGARTILSEDLADGQIIQGVTIKNPFR